VRPESVDTLFPQREAVKIEVFAGACGSEGASLLELEREYYDPDLGRFTTPDTVLDGLNRYAYCHNNPVRYNDPTGHMPGLGLGMWGFGFALNMAMNTMNHGSGGSGKPPGPTIPETGSVTYHGITIYSEKSIVVMPGEDDPHETGPGTLGTAAIPTVTNVNNSTQTITPVLTTVEARQRYVDPQFLPDIANPEAFLPGNFVSVIGKFYCYWLSYNVAFSRGVNPGLFFWYGNDLSKSGATITSKPMPQTAGYMFFYEGDPSKTAAGHVSYYEYDGGNTYIVWQTTGRSNPEPKEINIDNSNLETWGQYHYFQYVPLGPVPNKTWENYVYPYNHGW
jgi:RHS repeat-associated protein